MAIKNWSPKFNFPKLFNLYIIDIHQNQLSYVTLEGAVFATEESRFLNGEMLPPGPGSRIKICPTRGRDSFNMTCSIELISYQLT